MSYLNVNQSYADEPLKLFRTTEFWSEASRWFNIQLFQAKRQDLYIMRQKYLLCNKGV